MTTTAEPDQPSLEAVLASEYRNPILPGDRPDPAILKDGDEYWMTYSSFDSSPGLPLFRSTDLINWTFEGNALSETPAVVFAVDIAKVDGRYFIYIPFIPAPWSSEVTEPSVFVIHADSMHGPWSAPVDLGIRGVIDPGHLVDEEGGRHLFTSGVSHVRLTADGLSTDGELTHVYDGWEYPPEWITEAYALEGPKLFRRGEWYYPVSAVGGTAGPATGHMVIVARSQKPDGPWENCPHNPIARTADESEAWWSRGHATIFDGPDGQSWMISHGYRNGYRSLGRQMLLEPIEWTEDDWPRTSLADISGGISAPAGAARQAGELGFTDMLTAPQLGGRWAFHAPSPGETRRVTPTSEGMVLAAKGTSPADTSPLVTLVGAEAYTVEVTVELLSEDVEAGLLLFFNSRLFCGFGIDRTAMASYAGGQRTYWREPAPTTRAISLRLHNDRHIVTGWYRVGDGAWSRHAVRYETSGYHANTVGDLQGLRPALYASGAGAARFSDFVYRIEESVTPSPR